MIHEGKNWRRRRKYDRRGFHRSRFRKNCNKTRNRRFNDDYFGIDDDERNSERSGKSHGDNGG